MIYNLFKNFGYILKIIHNKEKKMALLEFEDSSSTILARDYMNNMIFLSNQLSVNIEIFFFYVINNKVTLSDQKAIIIKKSNQQVSEMQKSGNLQSSQIMFKLNDTEELLLNSLKEVGKAINIRINNPSEILHISNLSPSGCNENLIYQLFKDFGKIQNIQ